jgi:hypothetical protein
MFGFSKSPFYNKIISDYCKQSTMESLRRLTEIYNKTNRLIMDKNKYLLVSTLNPPPPPNFTNIFIFLSISSGLLYFFISTKQRH